MDWHAFVDDIVRHEPDRVVTRHRLDGNAPYFRDHFPGRPVLPGVLAVEALVAAGRVVLEGRVPGASRWVLGSARTIRFSRFLTPGQWLMCDVRLLSATGEEAALVVSGLASEDGRWDAVVGEGLVVAVSGRMTLRPARLGSAWNPRGS